MISWTPAAKSPAASNPDSNAGTIRIANSSWACSSMPFSSSWLRYTPSPASSYARNASSDSSKMSFWVSTATAALRADPSSSSCPVAAKRASMSAWFNEIPSFFNSSRSPRNALVMASAASSTGTLPPVHSDNAIAASRVFVAINPASSRVIPIGTRRSPIADAMPSSFDSDSPNAPTFFSAQSFTIAALSPNTVSVRRMFASISPARVASS